MRRRRERGGERAAAERLAQALHLPREEEWPRDRVAKL